MKSNKKLKVVLDTNVLVSALVFGGTPRVTVETVLKDGTFIISAEILSELRRIIHTKFPLFIEHLERLEKLIKRDAVLVELGGVQVAVCRDPDDNKIIETAVIGNASYIVSRDKDSLVLRSYTDIVILDSTEFLKILE